jgi:hypothetical protein
MAPPATHGPVFVAGVHYLVYMRVIGEIPHPACKITLFHWNNRYLIKFEQGLLEQTYKVQEYDVAGEAEIRQLVSGDFIETTLRQFETMNQAFRKALDEI